MIPFALCIIAFVLTFIAGRRSLGQGIVVLFGFGFFYGILRANLASVFSHFIFDCALIGLYLAQWTSSRPEDASQSRALRWWTIVLITWPALLVLLPFQPFLVSLVGLRGHIFFLPVLMLGARVKQKDLLEIGAGLAGLNLIALAFAFAEYRMGLDRFFPHNEVTQIIYASRDVAGGYFRIPSTFSSAAAFGGNMVGTLPYLLVLWERGATGITRLAAVIGMGAALVGVLMSATRSNFVLGLAIILVVLLNNRMTFAKRTAFVALIGVMAFFALTNERFQRFKSLSDTDYVSDRIAGSVNRGFVEILNQYPMGNGLGGGGTSMPYFLASQVRNPISMENEYAMILAEQGVIGLLIWLAFISWFFMQLPVAFARSPEGAGRRIAWSLAAFGLATAWLGLGLFTSIPGTALLVLGMGWSTSPLRARVSAPNRTALRDVMIATTSERPA